MEKNMKTTVLQGGIILNHHLGMRYRGLPETGVGLNTEAWERKCKLMCCRA